MPYFRLMNKGYPALEFEYDLESHAATRIVNVIDTAHAPIGLFDEEGNVNKGDLNYWWRHRAIPSSRESVGRLLDDLRLDSTPELAERSYGLSLSDRYWIDDVDAPQRWEDINFFDNEFSHGLDILTLGQDSSPSAEHLDLGSLSLVSPNATVGGNPRKKWSIIDGWRVLVKSGVGTFNQEPHNEIAATELQRRLLEPGTFTKYFLLTEDRRTYSVCENMLADNEELVSAFGLIRRRKRRNNESDLTFYMRCCEELGIRDVMDGLARMFVCDYVLTNHDRHWRNFGVMRDVETLAGTRLAPIFDTGHACGRASSSWSCPKTSGMWPSPSNTTVCTPTTSCASSKDTLAG